MPFQGWRRFKEAFAPELVRRAVEETGHVEHLVDPFGGSGTAALAAQFLGVQPSTIEVNPFLADLIEAKIGRYDLKAVVRAYAEVVARVQDGPEANPTEMLAAVPATFIEPGIKGRFLFPRKIAVRICTYRKAIEAVDDEASGAGLRRRVSWITPLRFYSGSDSLRDNPVHRLQAYRTAADRPGRGNGCKPNKEPLTSQHGFFDRPIAVECIQI
jgi:hypothetical protein